MQSRPHQFTLRWLLALVTGCGVLLAVLTQVPVFAVLLLTVLAGAAGVLFAMLLAVVGSLALLTAAIGIAIPGVKGSAFRDRIVFAGLWVIVLIVPATAIFRLLYVVATLPYY